MNGLITFISIASLLSSAWATIPNPQATTQNDPSIASGTQPTPSSQGDPNSQTAPNGQVQTSTKSLPPDAFIKNLICDKGFVPLPASLNLTHLPFDSAMCQNFAKNYTTLCYLNTCSFSSFATCQQCHKVLPTSNKYHIDVSPNVNASIDCKASWMIHDADEPNLLDRRPMCISENADTFLCDSSCSGHTTCGTCFNTTAFEK